MLVFVEVKTRRSEDFGRPIAAVGPAKQRTLSRAAIRYLGRLRKKPDYFRFDVVEVLGRPEDGEPLIRHLDDAFPFEARFKFPV